MKVGLWGVKGPLGLGRHVSVWKSRPWLMFASFLTDLVAGTHGEFSFHTLSLSYEERGVLITSLFPQRSSRKCSECASNQAQDPVRTRKRLLFPEDFLLFSFFPLSGEASGQKAWLASIAILLVLL